MKFIRIYKFSFKNHKNLLYNIKVSNKKKLENIKSIKVLSSKKKSQYTNNKTHKSSSKGIEEIKITPQYQFKI